MVGFDTCLMATVDVADTFSEFAHYLAASEETEPANGWYYSQWVGALAENTSMDGQELGRIICDTYYAGCEEVGTQVNEFNSYAGLGAGRAFKYFYAYELTGELDDSGMEYIADMDFDMLPEVRNLTTMDWDGKKLDVNDEGIWMPTGKTECLPIISEVSGEQLTAIWSIWS